MSQIDDIRQIIAIHCEHAPLQVLPLPPALVTSFETVPAEQRALLLDALLNSAMDGILAHRPDGTLVYFNSTIHDMLGFEQDEFAQIAPYGWIAPDALDLGPARIAHILEDGWLTYESSAMRKDLTLVPTEVRARRVETPDGPAIVCVIRDITERQAAQRQLLYMAFHDPLTGLANRALLDDRLSIAIANSRRHGDMLAAAYIDLDAFKPINDMYGHAVGDAALVQISQRLESVVRVQDTVARLGGDEFLVLLPRVRSPKDLPLIGAKLCDAVSRPLYIDGNSITITASVGLTIFEPEADDARSFIVKADCAMYDAKNLGLSGLRFSCDPRFLLADEDVARL